ncbi:hypothetical protein KIN20_014082 [Parelaphostrongylus tenuis]|uniref:Uncharacterized protein n=1 Tax=Parelaphostrongylus tenuis TaxID=148309 RepID=A0AAD5MWW7_PARTN|nr:hypothetical protein KIN20_014082 [Parelaphostrongylus tenuis]
MDARSHASSKVTPHPRSVICGDRQLRERIRSTLMKMFTSWFLSEITVLRHSSLIMEFSSCEDVSCCANHVSVETITRNLMNPGQWAQKERPRIVLVLRAQSKKQSTWRVMDMFT